MNGMIAKGFLEELDGIDAGKNRLSLITISQAVGLLWPEWMHINHDWSNRSLELSRGGKDTDKEYFLLYEKHLSELKTFLSERA